MRCGEECFLLEMELNGEKKTMPIKARTAIEARKKVRIEYGDSAQIFTVKKEKKTK